MPGQSLQFGHFTVSEMTKNDHFWPKMAKIGHFLGIFDLFWPKNPKKPKRRVKAGLRHQTTNLWAYFGDAYVAKGGGDARGEQNRFFQN